MDEKETSGEISFFRCDAVRTGHVVVGPGAAYAIRPWRAGFADESGAAGTAVDWFSVFQHVDVQVDPRSVGELFPLLLDVAAEEAETLRNAVAREIARAAADFHAPHAHLPERKVAERPHGGRHDPLALLFFAQPVADLDAALSGIGRFEADQSGEGLAVADRVDRIGRVGEHPGHHLPGLFDLVRVGHEREPAAQVAALGVDRGEDVRDVLRAEPPERVRAEEGDGIHAVKVFSRFKDTKKFADRLYKIGVPDSEIGCPEGERMPAGPADDIVGCERRYFFQKLLCYPKLFLSLHPISPVNQWRSGAVL